MTTPTRQTRRSVREAQMAQSQKSMLDFYKPIRGTGSRKRADPCAQVEDVEELAETSPPARTSGSASRLVEAIGNSSTIPLPSSYANLHELFVQCERVVSILTGMERRVTFAEVRRNVEKTSHRAFTRKHFGQILYVYSKAYDVHAEKCDIVIKVNTTDDLTDCLDRAKMKDVAYGRKQRLEAWRLTCRSQVFRHRLADMVKKAHADFLRGRGEQADVEAIKRFHPDFKLENLPPVPMIELPKPKDTNTLEALGAKDLLARTKSAAEEAAARLPEKVRAVTERPMKQLQNADEGATTSSSPVPLSPRKFDMEKKAPGPSLLERIRAKEEERKRIAMLRDEAGERRKRGIERLHADVLRILTTYYTYSKRSSLEWTQVVDRVVLSTRNMSRDSVEELLELLIVVAPSHVVSVEVRSRRYLKMIDNNHEDIAQLLLKELQL